MLKNLSLCLALILPFPLFAQTPPPGGKSLFDKPGLDALHLNGTADMVTMEKVPVEGEPFKEAVKLTTLKSGDTPWSVQVDAVCTSPVKTGDVILVQFWMRAAQTHVESGEAKSEFDFERYSDPWTKASTYALAAGPQWKQFSIPFTAVEDLDAGKSHICFRMGYPPQAFELADLVLLNYGTSRKLSEMPQTKIGYEGMEDDAPWRKAALDRIEKIRKGKLTVAVKDASGQPVSGAKVSVRMKKQAFGFGTSVWAKVLADSGTDNEHARQEIEKLFNRVVFENDLKWGEWEDGATNSGGWSRSYVNGAIKWLSDRHIDLRGHNMVWGSWKWLPASIKQLQGDPKALEAAIEKRIADVGGAMKGHVIEWDVVNEPIKEHDLTDILGKSAMVTWYNAARKADPTALLFVNDYPSPDDIGFLDGYDRDIQFLLDNHAPLQGIGLQGHVGKSPWSIPAFLATLDKLGAHGLPIEITEYDTDIQDQQLEAQFFRDYLTAIFSHPSVEGFLMWGIWDGSHWHHKAALFNQDWTPKPSEKVYEDLVLHDWWTNADGASDATGSYQVRGFLGDYEVTVTQGGKTVTLPAKLGKEGLSLPVTLK